MATNQEKEELLEILKFTPRTYRLTIWGYGGEKVMGTVDRKIYEYFKHRRLDVSDFAWNYDYAEENNIPEEMFPFYPGEWHDCDNIGHAYGVSMNAGTIQISDEKGNTVYERSLEDCDGCDDSPGLCCGDEIWIDSQTPGTVVFIGSSNEKGTFFEGDINLRAPFDIEKLEINYDEVDGEEMVTSIYYDGEEIENEGSNTDGKSSDFGFYVAGSLKDGKWEKYQNMDDIVYPMTDWFPSSVNPVREGVYMVKTDDGYTYQAKWTGKNWANTWSDEEIKIEEWQGLSIDPDKETNYEV